MKLNSIYKTPAYSTSLQIAIERVNLHQKSTAETPPPKHQLQSHFRITMQKQVKPARRETPGPTPRLRNNEGAKRIAPAAREDRQKSFPAKRDAAYCGYVKGI